jgi:NADPH:quinone reductase-like Zn-dependent oxidoreductase
MQPDAAELGSLATMIDAGKLHVEVARVFPLAEARAAHDLCETGHVRGKIVLRVRD